MIADDAHGVTRVPRWAEIAGGVGYYAIVAVIAYGVSEIATRVLLNEHVLLAMGIVP